MQTEHTNHPRMISKGNEFVGSGTPSLDGIIGGGYPVGSLVLINEDELGSYSDLFLQVFAAQGIQNKDNILLASIDDDTKNILKYLPQVGDAPVEESDNFVPSGSMQIAWRYETSFKPRTDISKHRTQSNNFYFKGKNDDSLKYSNIVHWPDQSIPSFCNLENTIVQTLTTNNHWNNLYMKRNDKTILRVVIHHLGSLLWNINPEKLAPFLYRLRCIARFSRAVILITLPHNLIKEKYLITRCEQISDIVLDLQSLDDDVNPLYNEYNGLIKFTKVSPINSLCSHITEGKDWAFKLIKKKLFIEKLTLPPELSTSAQREQDTMSCSSFNKNIQF